MALRPFPIAAACLLVLLAALPADAQNPNDSLPAPADSFVLNGGFEILRPAAPAGDEICEAYGDDLWLPPPPLPPLIILGCDADRNRAVHWSHPDDTRVDDFTGDGGTEILIGGSAGHNLWQAYPSPHQAYSARAEAYELQVKWSSLGEEGAWRVPNNAAVRLSLSTSPAETLHPYLVAFQDCVLVWSGATINAVIDADGITRLDPLAASFQSTYAGCDGAKAAWDAGTAEERLDLLGRLRVVQNSFWNFNTGGAVVILDNVRTVGSTLAAQEIAAGNHGL